MILEILCEKAGFTYTYLERGKEATRIPIRKLHGSLNWLRYSSSITCPASPPQFLFAGAGQYVYAFTHQQLPPLISTGEMPVLIPPIASKTYDEFFWHILRFAAGDIQSAAKILIVGYSFPPLDAFTRVHLQRLLQQNKSILYVSPSSKDVHRARELLGLPQEAVFQENWELRHFDALL